MAFEELDSSIKEPIKITLPVSKYTVDFVLPRMFHIEEVYKLNSKRKKGKEVEDKRFIDNLLVTTVRILDDKKQEVEEKYWEEFFEALPGKDIADLRDATKFDTGVDEISGLVCPYTGRELDIVIPLGPEFFRF